MLWLHGLVAGPLKKPRNQNNGTKMPLKQAESAALTPGVVREVFEMCTLGRVSDSGGFGTASCSIALRLFKASVSLWADHLVSGLPFPRHSHS